MVTNQAHTPGPWTLNDGWYIVGSDGDTVAEIYDTHHYANGVGLSVGNRRLIAAAPELLEALQIVCRAWDAARNNRRIEYTGPEVEDMARAAIKKATP